jgi:protein disulfide-isomerase A6
MKVISGQSTSRAKNIDDFLSANPTQPKALLFTTKSTTTPLFKALSVDFNNRLVLGEVRDTEKDIVAKFAVTKFPTLVIVPKDSTEHVVYDG